jgi:hypothetical protein
MQAQEGLPIACTPTPGVEDDTELAGDGAGLDEDGAGLGSEVEAGLGVEDGAGLGVEVEPLDPLNVKPLNKDGIVKNENTDEGDEFRAVILVIGALGSKVGNGFRDVRDCSVDPSRAAPAVTTSICSLVRRDC